VDEPEHHNDRWSNNKSKSHFLNLLWQRQKEKEKAEGGGEQTVGWPAAPAGAALYSSSISSSSPPHAMGMVSPSQSAIVTPLLWVSNGKSKIGERTLEILSPHIKQLFSHEKKKKKEKKPFFPPSTHITTTHSLCRTC
jgi:hypothetical protein